MPESSTSNQVSSLYLSTTAANDMRAEVRVPVQGTPSGSFDYSPTWCALSIMSPAAIVLAVIIGGSLIFLKFIHPLWVKMVEDNRVLRDRKRKESLEAGRAELDVQLKGNLARAENGVQVLKLRVETARLEKTLKIEEEGLRELTDFAAARLANRSRPPDKR